MHRIAAVKVELLKVSIYMKEQGLLKTTVFEQNYYQLAMNAITGEYKRVL